MEKLAGTAASMASSVASAASTAARRRAIMNMAAKEINLMTFNVLAPCYFRHGGELEAANPNAFLSRANTIVKTIQREKCDLICLQEYWFNDQYDAVFRQGLGRSHFMHTIKRPGLKEDGLAIFINRKKFDIQTVHQIDLDGNAGDRVAMMVHLTTKWNRREASLHQRSFLLINSHLTFPHDEPLKEQRLAQISLVLNSIRKYAQQEKLLDAPVLMCGDFNDFNDPVHDMVCNHGFASVFSQVHGREARVTHCNHNNREVGVDFIFSANLRNKKTIPNRLRTREKRLKLVPMQCDLLPRSLSDSTHLKRPSFGHEMERALAKVKTEADIVDYWRTISDHRPILATFQVQNPNRSRVAASQLITRQTTAPLSSASSVNDHSSSQTTNTPPPKTPPSPSKLPPSFPPPHMIPNGISAPPPSPSASMSCAGSDSSSS